MKGNGYEAIKELIRPNIAALVPYSCARNDFAGTAEVYLDANENWRDFVGDAGRNRYPDPLSTKVRKSVERALGLPASSLVIGNGSDEIIDLLMRIFCIPGKDSVLLMPPTYGAYRVFADINDVGTVSCPLTEDFQIDFPALERTLAQERLSRRAEGGRCKLLFVCSPNNPTGNAFPVDQIRRVCDLFDGVTVVDEAYFDFSPYPSAATLLDRYPRLVVLRTLSKSWALANARVGIAVACEAIVRTMIDTKYPYNLGGPSQDLAVQALSKVDEVKAAAQRIVEARIALARRLEDLPVTLRVFSSDANFLLVKVRDPDGLCLWLRERGIIIRNRSRELHCEGCVRITVGSEAENERLVEALERYGRR